MPTSWIEAIPEIFEEIYRLNPDSILDIGVGFGKYGVLLRERLEVPFERYSKEDWKICIDGIEAGIEVYAEDNINALLAEPGDFEELAKAVTVLLNSQKARDALGKAGRNTALKFSFSSTILQLENYLYQIVSHSTKAGI